jgi:hypothetical protein
MLLFSECLLRELCRMESGTPMCELSYSRGGENPAAPNLRVGQVLSHKAQRRPYPAALIAPHWNQRFMRAEFHYQFERTMAGERIER